MNGEDKKTHCLALSTLVWEEEGGPTRGGAINFLGGRVGDGFGD